MGGALCLALLLLMRLLMGSATNVSSAISKLMAQKITPDAQMVEYQVQFNSAGILAMALAPLLSSAVGVATAARSPGTQMGFPSGLIGLVWLGMVPLIWLLVPIDLKHSLEAKDAKDGLDLIAAGTPSGGRGATENDIDLRKRVWRAAVFYELERTISQVAIEVAASLILEDEFHWQSANVGFAVSFGFLLGVPMNELFMLLRRSLQLPDEVSARFCTIMGAVSTLLLWPGLGSWLLGSDVATVMLAQILVFT